MNDIKSKSFRNEWLNFTLYFVQFMYKTKKRNFRNKVCLDIITKDRLKANSQPLGSNQQNTVFLAKGTYYPTTFFKVNKKDLLTMENFYGRGTNNITQKRAKSSIFGGGQVPPLIGDYPNNNSSNISYFYKGIFNSNIVSTIFRYFS